MKKRGKEVLSFCIKCRNYKCKEKLMEKTMVPGIEQKVTIEDYFPRKGVNGTPQIHTTNGERKSPDDRGTVVVSKDFILNILSLAIGKPYSPDRSVGQKVDLKV